MTSVQVCQPRDVAAVGLGKGLERLGQRSKLPDFLFEAQLPGPEKFTPQNEMLKCWQKVPPVSEFKNVSLFKQAE